MKSITTIQSIFFVTFTCYISWTGNVYSKADNLLETNDVISFVKELNSLIENEDPSKIFDLLSSQYIESGKKFRNMFEPDLPDEELKLRALRDFEHFQINPELSVEKYQLLFGDSACIVSLPAIINRSKLSSLFKNDNPTKSGYYWNNIGGKIVSPDIRDQSSNSAVLYLYLVKQGDDWKLHNTLLIKKTLNEQVKSSVLRKLETLAL